MAFAKYMLAHKVPIRLLSHGTDSRKLTLYISSIIGWLFVKINSQNAFSRFLTTTFERGKKHTVEVKGPNSHFYFTTTFERAETHSRGHESNSHFYFNTTVYGGDSFRYSAPSIKPTVIVIVIEYTEQQAPVSPLSHLQQNQVSTTSPRLSY